MTNTKENLVQNILHALEQYSEIELVILYGSYANGKFTSASDIDLAIFYKEDHLDLEQLKLDLSTKLNKEVDLINLKKAPPTLLFEILTKGEVVLKKNDISHAALVKKMIFDQTDFMPCVRRIHEARVKRILNE
jgi:predicted nucleotidyltransferase